MAETLYEIPEEFDAGTTVPYRRQLPDYPASEGWALTAYLAGVGVAHAHAVADGDDHVITWTAAETAALAAGVYHYVERVTKGAEAHDVFDRYVKVTADIATATPGSQQELCEKAIAVLETHIYGRLPTGLMSYQVGGRTVSKMTIAEAKTMLADYKRDLARLVNPDQVTREALISFSEVGFDS